MKRVVVYVHIYGCITDFITHETHNLMNAYLLHQDIVLT